MASLKAEKPAAGSNPAGQAKKEPTKAPASSQAPKKAQEPKKKVRTYMDGIFFGVNLVWTRYQAIYRILSLRYAFEMLITDEFISCSAGM